jgi:hypothetical protein
VTQVATPSTQGGTFFGGASGGTAVTQVAGATSTNGIFSGGSLVPSTSTTATPSAIQSFINAHQNSPELIYNEARNQGLTGFDLDYAMGWAPGSADAYAESMGWPVLQGSAHTFNAYDPSTYTAPTMTAQGYTPVTANVANYAATDATANGYNTANSAAFGYNTVDAIVHDYIAAMASAQGYDPLTQQVTDDGLVENRVSGLLSQGSPLFDAAQQQAMEAYAGRGMLNSSDAINSGLRAIMSQATNIAGQDAGAINTQNLANQSATNAAAQFFANAKNATSMFNAGQTNAQRQFSANANNQASIFNAGQQNQANAFLASAQNAASDANATRQTDANRYASDAANQVSMYNAGAANTAAAANAAAANQIGMYNAGERNSAAQFTAQAQNSAAQNNQAAQLTALRDAAAAVNSSLALKSSQDAAAFENHMQRIQAAAERGDDARAEFNNMIIDLMDRGVFSADDDGSMTTAVNVMNFLDQYDQSGGYSRAAAYLVALNDPENSDATAGTSTNAIGLPTGVPAGAQYNVTTNTYTDSNGVIYGIGPNGAWVPGQIVVNVGGQQFQAS